MDLEAEILKEHSKRNIERIADWIGSDKRRFRELMNLLLEGEPVVTQRSAWILTSCYERYPALIKPWLSSILVKMQEPGVHDAVKRNVVRMLQCADIPRPLQGRIVSLCYEYLEAVDAPVAVKANAMGVLVRLAESEPALRGELRATIEHMMPYVGAALRARGRMVLKRLTRFERPRENRRELRP